VANKVLRLTAENLGFNTQTGALRSIAGNNSWSGLVDIRSADTNARTTSIGVDAGSTLDISGQIIGTNNAAAALANSVLKVGTGVLQIQRWL